MRWLPQDITITWMDGETVTMRCAGMCDAVSTVEDGILTVLKRDGEMAPIERLLMVPLVNVRHWKLRTP